MSFGLLCYCVFFCKQKTAYEMRISDWSSDVCSSDLGSRIHLMMGWRGPLPDIVSLPQVSKTIRLTALSCPSTLHSNTIESFQRSTAAGGLPRDNREKPLSILIRGISAALLAAGMALPALTVPGKVPACGWGWSE